MIGLLLPILQTNDAEKAIFDVLNHYKTLRSFSMRIEQADGSGLFPGTFTQSLKWRSGDQFELILTSKPTGSTTRVAPNYYAREGNVVVVPAEGTRRTESVKPAPNTSPGWEVCGGPILSFLQNTPMVELLSHPTKEFKISYSMGSDHLFRGIAVREINMNVGVKDAVVKVHYYLAEKAPQLVAVSFEEPSGHHGESRFLDQVENPTLPDKLGGPPK